MTTEETDPTRPLPTNVVEALARITGEIGGIERLNPTQRAQLGMHTDPSVDPNKGIKYAYRGIDQITQAAVPLLAKYGVVFVPLASHDEITRGLGNSGNMTEHIIVTHWRIYGPGGRDDYIDASTVGEARDTGDKGANKAQTAAFKNLLLRVLCITDPSDDTDNYDTREEHGPSRRAAHIAQRAEAEPELLAELFGKLKPQQRVTVQRYAAQVLGIREFSKPGDLSGNLAQAMRNVLAGREPHDDGEQASGEPALPTTDAPVSTPGPGAVANNQSSDGAEAQQHDPPSAAEPTPPKSGKYKNTPDDGHKQDPRALPSCEPGEHKYKNGECTVCHKEEPF